MFLQLTQDSRDENQDTPLSISETLSDSSSIDSFPSDLRDSVSNFEDKTCKFGHLKVFCSCFFTLPADVKYYDQVAFPDNNTCYIVAQYSILENVFDYVLWQSVKDITVVYN